MNTDKRIDFVIGSSQYSYGFHYNLVELESPNAKSFIKNKTEYVPSPQLAVAIEQVNSWQSWITTYKEATKEILPSKKFNILEMPHFSYSIYIGRRTDNPEILQKVNEYYDRYKINIYSYDKLTDAAHLRVFCDYYDPLHPFSSATDSDLNSFANPYRNAYKFAEWKKIVRSNNFSLAHMICENIKILLQKRSYSLKYDLFENEYKKIIKKI